MEDVVDFFYWYDSESDFFNFKTFNPKCFNNEKVSVHATQLQSDRTRRSNIPSHSPACPYGSQSLKYQVCLFLVNLSGLKHIFANEAFRAPKPKAF